MTKESKTGFWLGAVMAVVGFAAWGMNWRSALAEGHYRPIAALATPFIAFLGLSFLAAPPDEAHFIAQYGEAGLGRRGKRAHMIVGGLPVVSDRLR